MKAILLGTTLLCGALAGLSPRAPEIVWSPDPPRQGTLFRITVRDAGGPIAAVTGRFAGEALHFERDDSLGWWALAAVPVDAGEEGALEVGVTRPGGAHERLAVRVPIAPGSFRLERLSVAPRYTAPRDSALAARIEDESARAMAVARGAHDTRRLWSPGTFVRPRDTRITSGFGNGREFNGEVVSQHMGTDLQGAVGAPVLAPADGVVRLVDSFYLGGNVIYVDHGAGLSTGYLHLSEQLVAAGDTVRAGQRIGSVGATGRVTGPHLHWIVRYGGVTVDPLSLLEAGGR